MKMSLAFRHLSAIILVSVFFTSGAVVYQARTKFNEGKQSQNEVLLMIQESYIPSIAAGIFFFDDYQIRLLADGILLLPYVEAVELFERRGNENYPMVSAGAQTDGGDDIHVFEIWYEHEGLMREIGSLHVRTSMTRLHEQIADQVRSATFVNLLKIFGFSFVVLFIARQMIFRHLETISKFVRQLDFDNITKHKLLLTRNKIFSPNVQLSSLHSSDELDQISSAINHMLDNLALHLDEKETLIKELYHRTNNNMQVILGLLEYRKLSDPDQPLEEFVEDMNTKIQAMALVQQELYRAKHLSRIELKDYLQSVVSLALGRHSSQLNKLAVHYNLQPAKILLDTAIPLGTIIIEVVHHFLTHVFSTSFQNSHLAELRTTCRQSENGEIEIQITVEIQAPGVSIHLNDFNIEKIALAEGLVKQLGGTISVHGNGDLRCSIRFVDNLYTERV